MAKKNIGATLALYPCPVIVVGAMVKQRKLWKDELIFLVSGLKRSEACLYKNRG